MFPTLAEFYAVPYYDEYLYQDMIKPTEKFWSNTNFYGIDLSSLMQSAKNERLEQVIIDTHNPKTNLSLEAKTNIDFRKIKNHPACSPLAETKSKG